jgi:DNA-binding MarR family transcriptional regulator
MAYNDNKKYWTKITTEFLFDTQKIFKSEFAPWVYLWLKIKYKYYIEHAPEKKFKIPTKDISSFFYTTRSTVCRAVKELTQKGFLEKYGQLYKIKDESIYKTLYIPEESLSKSKYPEFLRVYYDHLERMIYRFKERIPKDKSNKYLLKAIEMNFYLSAKNRDTCMKDEEMIASKECVTSICRTLNRDDGTVKDILRILEDSGYIKQGKDVKITTVNIYFNNDNPNTAKLENKYNPKFFPRTETISDDAFKDIWSNDKTKVPKEPEGEYYYKTKYVPVPEMGAYKEVKVKVMGKKPAGYKEGGFIYENEEDNFEKDFDYDYNFSDN